MMKPKVEAKFIDQNSIGIKVDDASFVLELHKMSGLKSILESVFNLGYEKRSEESEVGGEQK
jgi:hypothetical protein